MENKPTNQPHKPDSWSSFYDRAAGWGPSVPLLRAIEKFQNEGTKLKKLTAVDLGCGEGRDTAELLKRGLHVIAIDSEADAIERICQRIDILPNDIKRLQTLVAPIEKAEWGKVDLINANLVLHLLSRDELPQIWKRITKSLKHGGRFSGTIVGKQDRRCQQATRFSQPEIEELFEESFAIEFINESQDLVKRLDQTHYTSHTFEVVARKF